jgi:DNA repair photolyase
MSSVGPSRGRGAVSNPVGRFERLSVVADHDGDAPAPRAQPTVYFRDRSREVISRNDSPDVPFDQSLNPYRGCEHGCIYCYARPTHEYFGLSAGLDFETSILVKEDAPTLLRQALARRSWTPTLLAMSGVTDPYQPIERTLGLTRRCLDVLAGCRQPVGIITKSGMVARDIDVLRELAVHRAVHVAISVTTLDEELRGALEPRAATAEVRLETLARLNEAGIPAGVMVAPVIPGLTDHEIPAILARAAEAGARFAGYILLRLPHGLQSLFDQWLQAHRPARRQRVLSRIRDARDGALSDPRFGSRMKGVGVSADLVGDLFRSARARARIPSSAPALSGDAFRRPTLAPLLAHLEEDALPPCHDAPHPA